MVAGGHPAMIEREGLWPSQVIRPGLPPEIDHNGFVTAMACRAMRHQQRPVPEAMLDGLARCQSVTGGFRFWPTELRPAWAPDLPDDTDDTALMTLELFRASRLSLQESRRIACKSIVAHRVRRFAPGHAHWRRDGVFATWHRPGGGEDLIDCTVIAHALTLMAALGLWHLPGVTASLDTLHAALDWAGDSASKAASLSPFYPDARMLCVALELAPCEATPGSESHADLLDLLRRIQRVAWADPHVCLDIPDIICCSPYGHTHWIAPKLATCLTRLLKPARNSRWVPDGPPELQGMSRHADQY
jgi:hypothetical protein